MSDIAIRVANLSKLYHIGRGQGRESYRTLRESMMDWAIAPLRWFSRDDRDVADDTIWALKDVSFEVKRGEVVGIIGRNGAGKSTLLKILSRITDPTEGTVDLYGRVGSLLEVGTGFHPELTGRDNIYLNGAILGMKRTDIIRKFDEIVDFAEIEKFLDTPVKHYSSGMYVRLAFAVAAHLDPEILLVDEVLAVGDAEFQKKCLGKMGSVAKEGKTVLFVSHNMHAISSLTTNSILLSSGKVIFQGLTSETISNYLFKQFKSNLTYNAAPSVNKVMITSVELITTFPNNIQIMGKPMSISIEVNTPLLTEDARLSVQIMNNENDPIAYFWSFIDIKSMKLESGNHIFVCNIPFLHLNSGNYTLTVHLSEGNGKRKLQLLEKICPFTVELFKTYHAGNWRSDFCTYIEDFKWDHKYLSETPK